MLEHAKNIDELLIKAVELGGSDLHLSVGAQPRVRVHGVIQNMEYPVLNTRTASDIIMPLLDTLARSTLNTVGQYDMAYSIHRVGRFRVNIFKQKGDLAGVFRVRFQSIRS